MMTDSLGDTNVHIISRVDGSGTERRRRDYLRSSEFVVRTGFLADDILGRARRGMHGEGLVFRHLCLTHFSDEECLTDISTQTQGSAVLLQIPPVYAGGRVAQPCRTPPHGRRTLGLGGGRLPGFRHTRTLESQANFGVGKTCQLVDVRARIRTQRA
jgi:hypothetical protein